MTTQLSSVGRDRRCDLVGAKVSESLPGRLEVVIRANPQLSERLTLYTFPSHPQADLVGRSAIREISS